MGNSSTTILVKHLVLHIRWLAMHEQPVTTPEATSQMEPRRTPFYRDWLVLLVFLAVVGIDQLTKYVVRTNLEIGEAFPPTGTFRILHIQNTGGAFGLFTDRTFIMVVASLIAVPVLLYLYRQYPFKGPFLRLALGLQMGGAIGNLIDRVTQGHVTDFIQLGWWPVFNVADSSVVAAIVIRVGLFVLTPMFKRPAEPDGKGPAASGDETPGTGS
jgi:signal peptidase II